MSAKNYRILVADNWGADASVWLKNRYPNVQFTVHTEAESLHPHGHMVAECICRMLPPDCRVEIVFYPHLLLQQERPGGWMSVISEARAEGRPFSVVNCSFGMHHGNSRLLRDALAGSWHDGTRLQRASRLIGDVPVFFAAGNQDTSKTGKPDRDNDVNYPQRPLSALPNVYVIGACDADGRPSSFSSDGMEVFAMYWGERVPVWHPLNKAMSSVSGTSFASPHAAGDLIRHAILKSFKPDPIWYLNHVLKIGTVSTGWPKGERHPKAGYGAMLGAIREAAHRDNAGPLFAGDEAPLEVSYLDFEEVNPS
jgi:hypothetical protein